jgi:acetyltransferase-like isoleucine patch superfamily enzyme
MKKTTINNERQSIINVALGDNVEIYNFVNLYGCSIGDGSKIGSFVEIQKGATIGKNCKISSHTFICEGVHISDRVFIGHNVTFINDLFPRATNQEGGLQTEDNWNCIETFIAEGASIGSSVTILCGVSIGRDAVIGAGSVVTKDVPDNTVYAGNPAKLIRSLNQKTA